MKKFGLVIKVKEYLNGETLNAEIRQCRKCRLSETRTNVLCGEGNIHARLILIAQAPGETEDKKGTMFIGPSGKILDELLNEAGVDREEIYMTNLIKCMLPKYRKPKSDETKICSTYLEQEIELINPQTIVTLGYYSTKYIFEKYGINLPSKTEFYNIYGNLFIERNRKILPLRHPAAVLFNNSVFEKMIINYRILKTLLTECKWYLFCPIKKFYEDELLEGEWISRYCKGNWQSCKRFQMVEEGNIPPDYMLPNGNMDENVIEYTRR